MLWPESESLQVHCFFGSFPIPDSSLHAQHNLSQDSTFPQSRCSVHSLHDLSLFHPANPWLKFSPEYLDLPIPMEKVDNLPWGSGNHQKWCGAFRVARNDWFLSWVCFFKIWENFISTKIENRECFQLVTKLSLCSTRVVLNVMN